ncbi:hypothetical protein DCB01_004828 [Escherichia coli]|nr:hypothetical protein [Escherichia coli]HBC6373722.1 hypothetical protein [Escherichia coli]HCX4623460.1 hypothetical protein [Escherichia coli]
MISLKRLSILTLLLGCSQFPRISCGATFYGSPHTFTVIKNFDIKEQPGKWISVGAVNDMNVNNGYANIVAQTGACASKFCTGGQIDLGYNGQSSYITYLTRTPVTLTDEQGNDYIFSVAYPNGLPEIYISDYNNKGGNYKHYKLSLYDAGYDYTSPLNSVSSLASSKTSELYCGHVNGCTITAAAWMKSSGGYPEIYIKLPNNLSAQTLTFSEQVIMSFKTYISRQSNTGTVETPTVSLKISGSITIPERCFLNVDKTSFNFSSIFSNANSGLQGSNTANVITTCNYAPEGTKQYIKINAISGGKLNADNTYYEIGNDSANNKSLGIIFKINDTISDCSADGDKFDSEQFIKNFSYASSSINNTNINFYLCKYGIPDQIGSKDIILRLTSRWVVD